MPLDLASDYYYVKSSQGTKTKRDQYEQLLTIEDLIEQQWYLEMAQGQPV